MKHYEYIKIPFWWIPEEICIHYKLYDLVDPDGYVYCEVSKGMYSLKQSTWLDFDNLVNLFTPHGYFAVHKSPGLWKHQTRPTVFTLSVENFGIKSKSIDGNQHLINTIRK